MFLTETDISIFRFGPHIDYKALCKESHYNDIIVNDKKIYKVAIQKYEILPSWTCVYGEHKRYASLKMPFRSYTINGRTMQVSCAVIINNQYIASDSAIVVKRSNIPPFPLGEKNAATSVWGLVVLIQLPSDTKDNLVSIGDIKKKE